MNWLSWDPAPDQAALRDFAATLTALRHSRPLLGWPRFLHDEPNNPEGVCARWLRPSGGEMTANDWNDPATRSLGLLLALPAESLLTLLNAADAEVAFALPAPIGGAWGRLVDTAEGVASPRALTLPDGASVTLAPHSMMLLESPPS